MTNTHKVQGIIKDDRREEQIGNWLIHRAETQFLDSDDKRTTPHNYDSPPKPKMLVYVKVEPELTINPDEGWLEINDEAWFANKEIFIAECRTNPYQKDDILELGEEWAEEYGCQYLTKGMDTSDPIQPASTCPSWLCKKIKVDKVIGVEEIDSVWNWAILGDEI